MTETVPVVVLGAAGRMGQTVAEAVAGRPSLAVAALVDPTFQASPPDGSTPTASSLAELQFPTGAATPVAVDFTVASAARTNAIECARRGWHCVIGTSGITDDDVAAFRAAFTTSNCLVAPNFAIGAVLMMRFAEMAAPFFPSAEVIELHHDKKVDAPSGTATQTVARLEAASDTWADDPTQHETIPGARGASGAGGIHVHSVRLRGLVAHQEVLLGGDGETLTLRHDSLDRSSFMTGVLTACEAVADHPGVTVGLEHYLGL